MTVIAMILLCGIAFAQKTRGTAERNVAKKRTTPKTPFVWEGANVYFIVTDRFNNGDKTNDHTYNRNKPTGKLRGFEGGDIRGIIQKLDEDYFTKLGINVIWMTPIVEQIHDGVDESGMATLQGPLLSQRAGACAQAEPARSE